MLCHKPCKLFIQSFPKLTGRNREVKIIRTLCSKHPVQEQADKLSSGEISKDDYDNWRYHYPEFDTTQIWAKVPSQELSDALVKMLKSDK